MIRVSRPASKAPATFSVASAQEKAEAIAYYESPDWDGKTSFEFAVYKEVRDVLNNIFSFKCAYCESKYEAVAPVDVEHYRPKAAVRHKGKRKKPGYYWLAAEWSNLLPSCIECNRSGKGNKFPIENEENRASKPDEESREKRLLLDPSRDFPEKHLEYLDEGLIRPRKPISGNESRKGSESIRVYGLQRSGLVNQRNDRLTLIKMQMRTVLRVIKQLDASPDDDELNAWLTEELQNLKAFQEPSSMYSGMAKQFIEQFMSTLT